jgi:hypothetical protein
MDQQLRSKGLKISDSLPPVWLSGTEKRHKVGEMRKNKKNFIFIRPKPKGVLFGPSAVMDPPSLALLGGLTHRRRNPAAARVSEFFTPGVERWPGKFGQIDRWIFCLRAAKLPRIRSEHDEANETD